MRTRLTTSGDQRLAHDSGTTIPEDTLAKLGVVYRYIPIDNDGKWEKEIDVFAKERGYKNVGHKSSALTCSAIRSM